MIGSALIGAAGSIGAGIASAFGASSANDEALEIWQNQKKFNRMMWKKNKRFAKEMSNTAYQRGMKDMRKAGLNPMLAYKQGGANVPNIGTATAPNAPQIRNELEAGLGMADAALQYNQIKQVSANTRLTNEQARSEHLRGNRLQTMDPLYQRAGDFLDNLDGVIDDLAPSLRDPKQLIDTVMTLMTEGDENPRDKQTSAVRTIITKKVEEAFSERFRGGSKITWKEYQRLRKQGFSSTGAHEIDKRNRAIKRHPSMRYRFK